jgi:hypothetical protein
MSGAVTLDSMHGAVTLDSMQGAVFNEASIARFVMFTQPCDPIWLHTVVKLVQATACLHAYPTPPTTPKQSKRILPLLTPILCVANLPWPGLIKACTRCIS